MKQKAERVEISRSLTPFRSATARPPSPPHTACAVSALAWCTQREWTVKDNKRLCELVRASHNKSTYSDLCGAPLVVLCDEMPQHHHRRPQPHVGDRHFELGQNTVHLLACLAIEALKFAVVIREHVIHTLTCDMVPPVELVNQKRDKPEEFRFSVQAKPMQMTCVVVNEDIWQSPPRPAK